MAYMCTAVPPAASRRRFLQTIALGGGATLLSTLSPMPARAAGSVDAVVLSCMDYRLADDVDAYMAGRGLTGKYDQLVLAGAALGVLTDKQPAWGPTFWQHVQIAKDLHHIHEIIVLDHRDCGAYRVFLGEALVRDPTTELSTHTLYLRKFRDEAGARFPDLKVELGIMALDGKVTTIT